jgi:hypothetical protein
LGSGQDKDQRRYAYVRRVPEQTVLYDVVREHLETFLDRARSGDRTVPTFVEREFRAYLQCGVLAHGFVRVRCDGCGYDRVVGFSCKGRGFCPSCGGRRMAETAALLADRILPEAPIRQWVLSLPVALRYRLAYDSALAAAVLRLFIRAVFGSLRRRARAELDQKARVDRAAVTFVQRFGDALNLNLHYHSLVVDGVYERMANGEVRFRRLPPPTDLEIERTTRRIARQLRRLLIRRSLAPDADPTEADPLSNEEPFLSEIYAASVRSRSAMAEQGGRRILRVGAYVDPEEAAFHSGPRCASVDGVSLHADMFISTRRRQRLERLCRYVARPPVSTERLSKLADGRLLYRLKRRWRDGTSHVLFEPIELIEKLAALVPPPRFHLVRYHGLLAPRAKRRNAVVGSVRQKPAKERETKARKTGSSRSNVTHDSHHDDELDPSPRAAPSNRSNGLWSGTICWADLMRRVFAIDVLECPRCRGRMRVIAAIHPPETTSEILECMDLPARAPPLEPPLRSDRAAQAFEALADW